MAQFYEAYANNQRICIKKINIIDGFSLDVAQQEVSVWCNLNHPNIVKYFQSFIEQNQFCIMMELVKGYSLDQFLANQGTLDESILHLFLQILSAIKHCHLNKVLHRDIKPQNILLTKTYQIKLADFGISRVVEEFGNPATTQIGTPYYMAPEILKKEPYSFPADIWSLGCVLYEIVTRRRPFSSDYIQFFQQILHDEPFPIHCNVSENLKSLIFSMLKKNPSERFTINQIENLPFILSLENIHNQANFQPRNYYSQTFSSYHPTNISQMPSIYPPVSSSIPTPCTLR